MNTPDLVAMRSSEADSRLTLLRKNFALHAAAHRLLRENQRLGTFNSQANANLTAVESRCTALLTARRELAWEVTELTEAIKESHGAWTMRARVAIRVAGELAIVGYVR